MPTRNATLVLGIISELSWHYLGIYLGIINSRAVSGTAAHTFYRTHMPIIATCTSFHDSCGLLLRLPRTEQMYEHWPSKSKEQVWPQLLELLEGWSESMLCQVTVLISDTSPKAIARLCASGLAANDFLSLSVPESSANLPANVQEFGHDLMNLLLSR